MPIRNPVSYQMEFTASDIHVSRDGMLAAIKLTASALPIQLRRSRVRDPGLCGSCDLLNLLHCVPRCPSRVVMHCVTHEWRVIPEVSTA
jgi:hypothetical protein